MAIKNILVCFLIVVLLTTVFAVENKVGYGTLEIASGGWNHVTKSFDFPCSGVADLPGTTCFKKNPPGDGEFSVSGPYTLVSFQYSCKTYNYKGGCWYGKDCTVKYPASVNPVPFQVKSDIKPLVTQDADKPFGASLVKGSFTATYVCSPCGHGEIAYYVQPTKCTVDVYTKTFATCDAFCKGTNDNANGKEENGACVCYCNDGYNSVELESKWSNGTYKRYVCKLPGQPEPPPKNDTHVGSNVTINVPSKSELEEKFTDDQIFKPRKPSDEELILLKAELSGKLGLNLDDFTPGIGNGKKALVVISTGLSGYEQMWIDYKAILFSAFYEYLGYDVEIVTNTNQYDIFKKMADPDVKAMSYFGHAIEPSLENRKLANLKGLMDDAFVAYYESQGYSKDEAKALAAQKTSLEYDMYYAHNCHGADSGYQSFANYVVRPGGVYYGEEGILWGGSYPDTEYIRP